jgi:hypothetical protein
MDDDTTRRGRKADDPGATGPLWPLPDDVISDDAPPAGDDGLTRSRGASAGSRSGASRGAPLDSSGRAPDQESTTVLSPAGPAGSRGGDPTRVASDGGRDWLDEPLPARPAPARAGRLRLRRAAPAWPRIVAPIVLLAAVLSVVTLGVRSGVLGHAQPVAGHPVAAASHRPKAKYAYYHVRKGDSMSTIAGKYHITLGRLLALNPRASSSTLAVGEKLKVPNTR